MADGRDRRSVFTGVAAFLVAGALVYSLGVPLYRGVMRHKVTSPNFAAVGTRSGLAFPPGAVLVHSCLDRTPLSPSEWTLFAVVRLPQGREKELIDSLPSTRQVSTRRDLGVDAPGYRTDCEVPEWWTPGKSRRFVAAAVPGKLGLTQPVRLLVALDDRDGPTVYLVTSANSR